jgi:hypothetical protein
MNWTFSIIATKPAANPYGLGVCVVMVIEARFEGMVNQFQNNALDDGEESEIQTINNKIQISL